MQPADWQARWREGKTAFHEADTHALLRPHADRLASAGRIFVPLCGKSRDMAFFAAAGAQVVGIDVSPIAAEAFFAESNLVPVRSKAGPFEVLSAGGVEIFVGDAFDATRELLGDIDGIYDRAALVALRADERPRYAALLASMILAPAPLFLISFEYDQSKFEGPPWAVPESVIRELFTSTFTIEKLSSRDVTDERPRFREAGLDRVSESAWLLSRT